MSLNESIVEDAALEWFGELGYAVGHGPHLAPGEPAAERASFSEVVLVGRLREAMQAIARVNRVYGEKPGGLIVDLIGLADPLADALKTYASATGDADEPMGKSFFEKAKKFF